jgi:hypothetical protein
MKEKMITHSIEFVATDNLVNSGATVIVAFRSAKVSSSFREAKDDSSEDIVRRNQIGCSCDAIKPAVPDTGESVLIFV